MKTLLITILILMSFISVLPKSAVTEAARISRISGVAEKWYANSMTILERPPRSPPPYPKPAPPQHYGTASSYSNNLYGSSIVKDGENDYNVERREHPPPSYPKPAPPHRNDIPWLQAFM